MQNEPLSAVVETVVAEQQAPQSQPDTAVEEKARASGWVPLEEFKGDPAKWKPADKWKSPDQVLSSVQKQLEKTRKAFDDFKRESADNFKRTERMNQLAIKQAKQDIIDKYEARKREAVKTGDEDAYEKADDAKEKALKRLDDEVEDAKPKKDEKGTDGFTKAEREAIEDWNDDNLWFKTNAEMTKFADSRFRRITRDNPDMPIEDALSELREAVEERFPDYPEFNKRKANGAARVEGGGRDMDGGRRASGFSSLPADAKAQADRFIKEDGLFLQKGETVEKNLAQARERYAAEYLKANVK